MQKRILLVLLVLLAASMSVFAMDQVSVAAKLPYFEFNSNLSQTTIIVGGSNNTLFAGVDGSVLTDDEMMMVEGEGVATGVAGEIIGGVLGGMYESIGTTIRLVAGKENRTSKEISSAVLEAMLSGAICGAAAAYIPLP